MCRAAGALWLEAERVLIVADLHLEKGSSFAVRGQMLPPYDTRETLARLEAEVDGCRPASSSSSATPSTTRAERTGWRPTITAGSKPWRSAAPCSGWPATTTAPRRAPCRATRPRCSASPAWTSSTNRRPTPAAWKSPATCIPAPRCAAEGRRPPPLLRHRRRAGDPAGVRRLCRGPERAGRGLRKTAAAYGRWRRSSARAGSTRSAGPAWRTTRAAGQGYPSPFPRMGGDGRSPRTPGPPDVGRRPGPVLHDRRGGDHLCRSRLWNWRWRRRGDGGGDGLRCGGLGSSYRRAEQERGSGRREQQRQPGNPGETVGFPRLGRNADGLRARRRLDPPHQSLAHEGDVAGQATGDGPRALDLSVQAKRSVVEPAIERRDRFRQLVDGAAEGLRGVLLAIVVAVEPGFIHRRHAAQVGKGLGTTAADVNEGR